MDYKEDKYGVRYSEDGKELIGYNRDVFQCEHFEIPDGVTKIAANAFHNCQTLKSVVMPDSVVEDDGSIFEGCKNLKDVRVSANLKNPNIAMFCGCSSLSKVYLPDGIESIGENMFTACKALQHIDIPSTVGVLCGDTFCGSGIEEIILPEGLKHVGHDAFISCYNLKRLTIPSTVKSIGPWLVQGHKDFKGVICHSKSFRIEDDALISNDNDTLLACWTKQTIYHLPASVKKVRSLCNDQIETLYIDPLTEIGYEAFISCPSLKNIEKKSNVQRCPPRGGWMTIDECFDDVIESVEKIYESDANTSKDKSE